MKETENEPYTRWQGFRINQLGLCISLFLSFAVATLGFSLHLLVQSEFPITSCYAKVFFVFSAVFGLLSILLGSIACVTRLTDFRITAKVARRPSDSESDHLRDCYVRLGKWTWRLFKGQLVLFGLQATGLILALGITYWRRLV